MITGFNEVSWTVPGMMTLTTEFMAHLDRLREAASLDAERLDLVEQLADTLPAPAVADAAAAATVRLPERGVHPSLHYLLARLAARRGDREEAAAALDRLLERLNQDGAHALLVEVARRNADWLPAERLLSLLVRAGRLADGALSDAALAEMLDRYPEDPRLHWLAGLRQAARTPPPPAALRHLARALAYLAREEEPLELEGAALKVIEGLEGGGGPARAAQAGDGDGEVALALADDLAPDVLAMLAALIERRRIEEASTYLDLGLEGLLAHGQRAALWELLRGALTRDSNAAPLRPAALAALAALHAGEPHHARVVADSGLPSPEVLFATALARYTRLMEFPPGGHVEHGSWGVGEILAHDGEDVTVRFANRPEHVFKRSLADRALERRAPDDLRVLLTFFPERLAELRDRDPAGLTAVALRALGGEGRPRDLKRLLSPAVVPAESWSEWWKRARAAFDEDERIDLTQSFRDLIRLAGPGAGAGDLELPNLVERGDVARQLKLLRRFFDQHPEARERASRAYRRRLERWLATRTLTHEERILVLILIAGWEPEARVRLRDELGQVSKQGFSLAAFPDDRDQVLLFELGIEAAEWQPVAMAALDSKQPALRRRALAAVEERLGPGAHGFYRQVLELSPLRGDAVMEVVRGALAAETPGLAAVSPVELFIALLKLVSEPERETLRKQAHPLLAADGPVCARLAAEPAQGPGAEQVALALLGFRASDSYLFPILGALERIWGPPVVEAFRRRRERETQRIAARMDGESGELPLGLMTRASFEALKSEMERVDYELRTTIPRAIQRARELGDLRENGEYESAKLKQRQASERLLLLQRQLADAQIIDELAIDDSMVQPGTEVVLRPVDGPGEAFTFWILGEGDSRHGPEVVSYRAELGRALWRRRPGEEVELPLPGGPRRVRIERVGKRLPA